jgi:predicted small secreted protein
MNVMGTMALASVLAASSALAAGRVPQTAGQDVKHAGTETKDAAKDAGSGVKKGTKTGYRKTKNGTKKAYHKTASGTKKVYHKTGKGLEKTGDKIEGKPDTK